MNEASRPYYGLPTNQYSTLQLLGTLSKEQSWSLRPKQLQARIKLGLIRKTSCALSLLIIFSFQFGLLGVLLRLHAGLAFVKSKLSFALE